MAVTWTIGPGQACVGQNLSAPLLQPLVTRHDTPRVHALSMRRGERGNEAAAVVADELPELNPWREIGWIFRDGHCIAIERQGDETRARSLGE
jgi:hypothetical protein